MLKILNSEKSMHLWESHDYLSSSTQITETDETDAYGNIKGDVSTYIYLLN